MPPHARRCTPGRARRGTPRPRSSRRPSGSGPRRRTARTHRRPLRSPFGRAMPFDRDGEAGFRRGSSHRDARLQDQLQSASCRARRVVGAPRARPSVVIPGGHFDVQASGLIERDTRRLRHRPPILPSDRCVADRSDTRGGSGSG
ncbi:hypothetical protein SGPA1_10181 [Streptomyces misionensis JCM 4497]